MRYIQANIEIPEDEDEKDEWGREKVTGDCQPSQQMEESSSYCVTCSEKAAIHVPWEEHNTTVQQMADALELSRFNLNKARRELKRATVLRILLENPFSD